MYNKGCIVSPAATTRQYNCALLASSRSGDYISLTMTTMMVSDDDIVERLEEATRNAEKLQRETLHVILERNSGVRYLQPYLPGDHTHPVALDPSTFRRIVPLSSYSDYADYIHKLADGALHDGDDDKPLMSFDDLLCFFYSSGTSSMKPKLIPYFDSKPGKAASSLAYQSSAAIFRRLFPPRAAANKILALNYAGNVTQTKGGYKAMAASSFPFHSSSSNLSHFPFFAVSPKEVILGSDVRQQMYCHLLCGLKECDLVDGIRAPYAAGLIRAFALLEAKWEQLCQDLENGSPSSELITDIVMRESVVKGLCGPQVVLSKRVRTICEGNAWDGAIGKLWPNARYVKTVTTGSMMQYYAKLKYYAGPLPILGGDYFASECPVAVNMDITQHPELTRYVMLPTCAYFEFLRFDLDKCCTCGEDAVDFSGVEVGSVYEVIVTTYRGLFRYRLGDIVKVVGFYNSSPQIELIMRTPNSSDDIITEKDLLSSMASLELAMRDVMATEIVEFASFLNLRLEPHHLKVFVEFKQELTLGQKEQSEQLIKDLRRGCSLLEHGLGGVYQVMKTRGELGPLMLFVVNTGSFDRLLDLAVEKGSPASQYKPPKIIRSPQIAQHLESSAIVCVTATVN